MATQVKAINLPEGYQTILSNGRHSIIGDEPVKSNGTDLGFNPSELLLAALAMCKTGTVRFIARKNGWNIKNVTASLVQEVKRSEEGMEANIKVHLEIEGDLTKEQRQTLNREADKCYIHRLLKGNWNIEKTEQVNTLPIDENGISL